MILTACGFSIKNQNLLKGNNYERWTDDLSTNVVNSRPPKNGRALIKLCDFFQVPNSKKNLDGKSEKFQHRLSIKKIISLNSVSVDH